MSILSFFTDMFWFANVGYSYSLAFVLVAFVLYIFLISFSINQGTWNGTVQPIADVQPPNVAIIHGISTTETPYEWNGKQLAYFYDFETKEIFPKDEIHTIQDESGQISVHVGKPGPFSLKEYIVSHPAEDPEKGEKKYLVIENGSKLYCRGKINKEGAMAYNNKARDTVSLQSESFEKNIREEKKTLAIMILFVFALLQAYPFYAYQNLWNTELDDVVKEKWTIKSVGYFTLEKSGETIYVGDTVYEACPEGANIHKEPQSLNLECGPNPESLFTKNLSIGSQCWQNSGLLFFAFLSLLIVQNRKD